MTWIRLPLDRGNYCANNKRWTKRDKKLLPDDIGSTTVIEVFHLGFNLTINLISKFGERDIPARTTFGV